MKFLITIILFVYSGLMKAEEYNLIGTIEGAPVKAILSIDENGSISGEYSFLQLPSTANTHLEHPHYKKTEVFPISGSFTDKTRKIINMTSDFKYVDEGNKKQPITLLFTAIIEDIHDSSDQNKTYKRIIGRQQRSTTTEHGFVEMPFFFVEEKSPDLSKLFCDELISNLTTNNRKNIRTAYHCMILGYWTNNQKYQGYIDKRRKELLVSEWLLENYVLDVSKQFETKEEINNFLEAQLAWEKYRDLHCVQQSKYRSNVATEISLIQHGSHEVTCKMHENFDRAIKIKDLFIPISGEIKEIKRDNKFRHQRTQACWTGSASQPRRC